VDFKVFITHAALNDLDEIVEYISRDDVNAAQRTASDLLNRAESLQKMPRRGKAMRSRPGVRRLVRNPYLIIYRIEERLGS
jgi:plasmid stabilization system protein ParE